MTKKLLQVLTGEPISPPPFWFMRQAGRYLPEYKETRAQAGSFLNLCFNPELAAEVTHQPIRRYGMDAAILFADILVIPLALGIDLKFETGEGPKLGKLEIGNLRFEEEKLDPIYQTLKVLSSTLKPETALIGFAGSPWTVATYVVEGGSSRDFVKTKTLAKNNPAEFQKLIDIIADATATYLISQIKSGAETVQLFDSWAGALQGDEFTKWVIKPTKKITEKIKSVYPKIKIIGFPKNAGQLYKTYAEQTDVDALSICQHTDLAWAFENIKLPLQGNLDPEILMTTPEKIQFEATKILDLAKGKPFIFNLGHGIGQFTPPENVEVLSNTIKSYK